MQFKHIHDRDDNVTWISLTLDEIVSTEESFHLYRHTKMSLVYTEETWLSRLVLRLFFIKVTLAVVTSCQADGPMSGTLCVAVFTS